PSIGPDDDAIDFPRAIVDDSAEGGPVGELRSCVAVVVASATAAVGSRRSPRRTVVSLDGGGLDAGETDRVEQGILLNVGQNPVTPVDPLSVVHLAGRVLGRCLLVVPVAAILVRLPRGAAIPSAWWEAT